MPTEPPQRPSLLVLELWGLGDLVLAVPFLREACRSRRVVLLAKPHAAPLLRHFAPEVELHSFVFPWTAFRGKYRLWEWPWGGLRDCLRRLRQFNFAAGVSARPDPRDHALLLAAGCRKRLGFPRAGSRLLLNVPLPLPSSEHRAAHWSALAAALGLTAPAPGPAANPAAQPRHLVLHTGAGHPVRAWPLERWRLVAGKLESLGWRVTLLDDSLQDVDRLISILATAERFVGNDSGPGHIAALLGVPTFTLFGPQLPARFSPVHPLAAWHPGAFCPWKPCKDACRFPQPDCMLGVSVDELMPPLRDWLERQQ